MNVSKSVFVVLLISVFSMLMLASSALAAGPTLAVSGVPSNVVSGTQFTVTATAVNSTAGQTINTVTLVNTLGWDVAPQNTVSCVSGSQSCVATFSVSVPSGTAVGQSSVFTTQATASTGEVTTDTKTSSVSGAPSVPSNNKVPVSIDSAQIDGFDLSQSGTTVRDMERGQSFKLKVQLTGTSNANAVEVRAFVTGFDSSSNKISDSTNTFDVVKGVSYVKTLSLKLPDNVQEDTYRIRVIIGGRDNDEVTQDYRIQVTPAAHQVVVRDFSINPEDTVQSGRAILATVRVKNQGDKTENDIKVRVSIPELGVTANPDFISDLKTDESATSEEFFLRVDQCARPGTYDVVAEITFDDGDKTETSKKQITVTKGGACDVSAGGTSVSASGFKVDFNSEPQNVVAGGAAVSYPLTITNSGTSTKSYSLSVVGADWAAVKFSPSNMVTVKPGDSQTVYAFVSANSNAAAGGQSFIVRVKDQAGDVLRELSLSANVAAGAAGFSTGSLVQLLQLGLIVLIVVLVVVGVVVAFRRMKGPGASEEGAQTYY